MTHKLVTVIAIDGPAASGKTTVGLALAERLGYRFIDTGSLYRAFTWLALEAGVPVDDEQALSKLAGKHSFSFRPQNHELRVWVDNEDATPHLREAAVEDNVSAVSRHPAVRARLQRMQRDLVEAGRVVMAGRDIGTVIAPDAGVKIFLAASPDVRVERRLRQQGEWGGREDRTGVQADVTRRDRIDSTREASPLKPAADAMVIQTDSLTVEEVLEAALACTRKTL